MKHKNKIIAAASLALCLIMVFTVSACSIIGAIAGSLFSRYLFVFNNSEYNFTKNETRTFTSDDFRFEELPAGLSAADIDFTLSSDNLAVVSASGKTITAVGTGKTRISAITDDGTTAYAYVTVTDPIEKIELVYPLGNYLPMDGYYSVDVFVVINDGTTSSSDAEISWTVNGEKITDFTANPLTLYKPKSEQSYVVTATIASGGDSFSAEGVAGYYAEEPEKPQISSDKNRAATGESFDFNLKNGDSYTEWYINGEYVTHGEDFSFESNAPGYYEITAANKGVFSEPFTVMADGEIGVGNLEVGFFDNYPALTAKWQSAGDGFEYEVTCENGADKKTYRTFDSKIELEIDPTEETTVAVRSLGDGKFAASKKSELKVQRVERSAVKFLSEKWFGGDYFMESDADFYDFFDYMMYFRPQPENGKSTTLEKSVYMAYDYGDFKDLLGRAFDYSGITGSYSISGNVKNNIATVKIEFFTGNVPTQSSAYNASKHYSPLDAITMHKSGSGGKPWFENATKGTAAVATTDQMFRAAEKGFVPVPEENSSAEAVYLYAENVLKNIIDESSSDYEIAHAVYDYIINKNTYDGCVVNYDIKQSVKSAAFYMESILSDSDNYGVCDGMSKTFSFLCNMAGVDAVRVTGYAGNGEKGGHAWNKVKIDGEWYVVDCTWGDVAVKVYKKSGFGYKSAYYESASHTYFLLTDESIADTHVADLTAYPKTTDVPFNYYAQYIIQSSDYATSLYVQSEGEQLAADLGFIAEYVASSATRSHDVESYGISRKSGYYAVEFSVCERSVKAAREILENTLFNNFYMTLTRAGLGYNIVNDDNVFIVIVSKNGDLHNNALSSGSSSDDKFWWL